MSPASGRIIFPQLSFVPSKWAYFSKTVGSSKQAHYFSPTTNWLKQAGILFFPNYQMAQASGHIIFPQLSIGSSKRAYNFSPTLNWPQRADILFSPNSQLSTASGHTIFLKHQLAQTSGHIIFPQLSIGSRKRAYYFTTTYD